MARASPRYRRVPRHLRRLYQLIERTRYEQVFARVVMPPRHGKTETFTHALVWRAQVDPACLNFYVTFGDQLANTTMRKTLRVGQRAGVNFAQDVKNLHEWRVAEYDGGIMATTVGGQITGRGCNGGLIIGDDLIKGRKTAESRLARDTAWDFLRDDMMSRLEYGASMIIVGTRWHPDDPIGRLHKDPLGLEWVDIHLPAVHDGAYNPVDDRAHGDPRPLAPDFGYDLDWARKVRARGEYGWWSLYQGVPRVKGGKLFPEPSRFERQAFVWTGKRGVVGVDVAGTAKTYSNWSAFVVMAMAGYGERSEAWILFARKLQEPTWKVAEELLKLQQKWRLLLGVEVNGLGRAVADELVRPRASVAQLRVIKPSLRIKEVVRTKDKFSEAQGLSAAWCGLRVHVPTGSVDWDVDEYLADMGEFTGIDDPDDDFTDATVNAWNCLYSEVPLGHNYRTEEGEEF